MVRTGLTLISPTVEDRGFKSGHVLCDCCCSSENSFVATKRGYKLYRCRNCGLIFVYPQPKPKDLAKIYRKTASYFATANADLSKTPPDYALRLHEMLLGSGIAEGNFLDVGCGTGALIYHMRKLGWKVTGTEINPDAAAVALQNHLDLLLGELEKYPFDDGSFDVIHLGNVIEHVRSPRGTLLTVHRLLRKGGLTVINTPNAKCGFAVSSLLLTKVFRFPWLHCEAPYHLYDFCPQTLSRLVSSVGFDVVSLNCSRQRSFLYTVGATGFFDDLKASMKKTGKYRFNSKFLMNIPKLAIVASVILPFYLWGRLTDMVLHTGYRISLLARRL